MFSKIKKMDVVASEKVNLERDNFEFDAGNFDKAIKCCDEALEINPENVVSIIKKRFDEIGNPAQIPLLRGDKSFKAKLSNDGIHVTNLGNLPFLPWQVFVESVSLLKENGGRAKRGNARGTANDPRILGDDKLPLNSIEGHIAHVVYGKQVGGDGTIFMRITPIACILIWAKICQHEPGELLLFNKVSGPRLPEISYSPTVVSAFGYKGAIIQYKVKVKNHTAEPIADVKVNLYVPDVFLAPEPTKNIAILKPGEGKTVTFEIRPTGECGDCEVSGKVVYYDYSTRQTTGIDIPPKSMSIICPMLKMIEINESQWYNTIGHLIEIEECTREIDMSAETLFTMTSRIVKDMHMHPLNPEITNSQQLFNGVARFYGEGIKGLKYGAQIEVLGGSNKSKLILKTWAEKEEALTGFYHGLLDAIDKRVLVKGYIDEPITQNFINVTGHYINGNVGRFTDVGDRTIQVGSQEKDHITQRSNVGAGEAEKKCLTCGTVAEGNGKFCNGCGTKR